jgi:uncharacterized phage protein gp47/JayE
VTAAVQTAEQPQDRMPLAKVAAESCIAEVYNVLAAEDTAVVAAAVAARARLRRSFLLRVEAFQCAHVSAVSADLRRIQEDVKQVFAAVYFTRGGFLELVS